MIISEFRGFVLGVFPAWIGRDSKFYLYHAFTTSVLSKLRAPFLLPFLTVGMGVRHASPAPPGYNSKRSPNALEGKVPRVAN